MSMSHEPLFKSDKNTALKNPIVYTPEKFYYEPPCDFKKYEVVSHATIRKKYEDMKVRTIRIGFERANFVWVRVESLFGIEEIKGKVVLICLIP